jgi:hypothetical protein
MLTTTGLTNGGITTHYKFQYDDSLSGPGGPEPARTNAVIAACESDFKLMSGWFKNISLGLTFPSPIAVTQNSGGASWSSSGSNLAVTINPGVDGAATFIRYLLVSEIVDVFMSAQGTGWFDSAAGDEGSIGEGLSRFLAAQFLAINGFGNPPAGFTIANDWLSSSRINHVTQPATSDNKPDERTGCSCLFIGYLNAQLGFSVDDIVASGASTLAGVYAKLTADTPLNAYPPFAALVCLKFPGTSTITSGNLDNPFPFDFTISGNISDTNGHQIFGSKVEVSNATELLHTNPLTSIQYAISGNAQFYYGNWTVTASAPGFDSISLTLKIPNGSQIVQNFLLQKAVPGEITGVVTDDGGTGLPLSHVWIGSKTGPLSTISDDQGRYTLTNVPPGTLQLTASHGTLYLQQQDSVVVTEGKTTIFDIALVRKRPQL